MPVRTGALVHRSTGPRTGAPLCLAGATVCKLAGLHRRVGTPFAAQAKGGRAGRDGRRRQARLRAAFIALAVAGCTATRPSLRRLAQILDSSA